MNQRPPTDSSDDEQLHVRKRSRRQILSPDTPSSSSRASTPKVTPSRKANGVHVPSIEKSEGPGPSSSTQGSESSPAPRATTSTPSKGNRPNLLTLADLGLGDREAPPCPNYSGYSTLCLRNGEIEWEKAYSLSPQHRPVIERMVSWFNSEDMTRDGISQVMRNDSDYRELFRKYRGLLGVRIGLLRQEFLPDAEGYEIVHVGPPTNSAPIANGTAHSTTATPVGS